MTSSAPVLQVPPGFAGGALHASDQTGDAESFYRSSGMASLADPGFIDDLYARVDLTTDMENGRLFHFGRCVARGVDIRNRDVLFRFKMASDEVQRFITSLTLEYDIRPDSDACAANFHERLYTAYQVNYILKQLQDEWRVEKGYGAAWTQGNRWPSIKEFLQEIDLQVAWVVNISEVSSVIPTTASDAVYGSTSTDTEEKLFSIDYVTEGEAEIWNHFGFRALPNSGVFYILGKFLSANDQHDPIVLPKGDSRQPLCFDSYHYWRLVGHQDVDIYTPPDHIIKHLRDKRGGCLYFRPAYHTMHFHDSYMERFCRDMLGSKNVNLTAPFDSVFVKIYKQTAFDSDDVARREFFMITSENGQARAIQTHDGEPPPWVKQYRANAQNLWLMGQTATSERMFMRVFVDPKGFDPVVIYPRSFVPSWTASPVRTMPLGSSTVTAEKVTSIELNTTGIFEEPSHGGRKRKYEQTDSPPKSLPPPNRETDKSSGSESPEFTRITSNVSFATVFDKSTRFGPNTPLLLMPSKDDTTIADSVNTSSVIGERARKKQIKETAAALFEQSLDYAVNIACLLVPKYESMWNHLKKDQSSSTDKLKMLEDSLALFLAHTYKVQLSMMQVSDNDSMDVDGEQTAPKTLPGVVFVKLMSYSYNTSLSDLNQFIIDEQLSLTQLAHWILDTMCVFFIQCVKTVLQATVKQNVSNYTQPLFGVDWTTFKPVNIEEMFSSASNMPTANQLLLTALIHRLVVRDANNFIGGGFLVRLNAHDHIIYETGDPLVGQLRPHKFGTNDMVTWDLSKFYALKDVVPVVQQIKAAMHNFDKEITLCQQVYNENYGEQKHPESSVAVLPSVDIQKQFSDIDPTATAIISKAMVRVGLSVFQIYRAIRLEYAVNPNVDSAISSLVNLLHKAILGLVQIAVNATEGSDPVIPIRSSVAFSEFGSDDFYQEIQKFFGSTLREKIEGGPAQERFIAAETLAVEYATSIVVRIIEIASDYWRSDRWLRPSGVALYTFPEFVADLIVVPSNNPFSEMGQDVYLSGTRSEIILYAMSDWIRDVRLADTKISAGYLDKGDLNKAGLEMFELICSLPLEMADSATYASQEDVWAIILAFQLKGFGHAQELETLAKKHPKADSMDVDVPNSGSKPVSDPMEVSPESIPSPDPTPPAEPPSAPQSLFPIGLAAPAEEEVKDWFIPSRRAVFDGIRDASNGVPVAENVLIRFHMEQKPVLRTQVQLFFDDLYRSMTNPILLSPNPEHQIARAILEKSKFDQQAERVEKETARIPEEDYQQNSRLACALTAKFLYTIGLEIAKSAGDSTAMRIFGITRERDVGQNIPSAGTPSHLALMLFLEYLYYQRERSQIGKHLFFRPNVNLSLDELLQVAFPGIDLSEEYLDSAPANYSVPSNIANAIKNKSKNERLRLFSSFHERDPSLVLPQETSDKISEGFKWAQKFFKFWELDFLAKVEVEMDFDAYDAITPYIRGLYRALLLRADELRADAVTILKNYDLEGFLRDLGAFITRLKNDNDIPFAAASRACFFIYDFEKRLLDSIPEDAARVLGIRTVSNDKFWIKEKNRTPTAVALYSPAAATLELFFHKLSFDRLKRSLVSQYPSKAITVDVTIEKLLQVFDNGSKSFTEEDIKDKFEDGFDLEASCKRIEEWLKRKERRLFNQSQSDDSADDSMDVDEGEDEEDADAMEVSSEPGSGSPAETVPSQPPPVSQPPEALVSQETPTPILTLTPPISGNKLIFTEQIDQLIQGLWRGSTGIPLFEGIVLQFYLYEKPPSDPETYVVQMFTEIGKKLQEKATSMFEDQKEQLAKVRNALRQLVSVPPLPTTAEELLKNFPFLTGGDAVNYAARQIAVHATNIIIACLLNANLSYWNTARLLGISESSSNQVQTIITWKQSGRSFSETRLMFYVCALQLTVLAESDGKAVELDIPTLLGAAQLATDKQKTFPFWNMDTINLPEVKAVFASAADVLNKKLQTLQILPAAPSQTITVNSEEDAEEIRETFRALRDVEVQGYGFGGVLADRLRLIQRLGVLGLNLITIPGDGDCQFGSLADQLKRINPVKYQDYNSVKVREEVVARIKAEATFYNAFFQPLPGYYTTWEEYLDKMSRRYFWGDNPTLMAAADTYQIKILLVSSRSEATCTFIHPKNVSTQEELKLLPLAVLAYRPEVHYDSTAPS